MSPVYELICETVSSRHAPRFLAPGIEWNNFLLAIILASPALQSPRCWPACHRLPAHQMVVRQQLFSRRFRRQPLDLISRPAEKLPAVGGRRWAHDGAVLRTNRRASGEQGRRDPQGDLTLYPAFCLLHRPYPSLIGSRPWPLLRPPRRCQIFAQQARSPRRLIETCVAGLVNLKVTGSNPVPATKIPKSDQRLKPTPRIADPRRLLFTSPLPRQIACSSV